nr:hypothetical protein [Tanacetum cinerariifolium]
MYYGSHECMAALDLEVQQVYPPSFKLEDNRLNHSCQEVRHKPTKTGHYKHHSSRNKNHYTQKKERKLNSRQILYNLQKKHSSIRMLLDIM